MSDGWYSVAEVARLQTAEVLHECIVCLMKAWGCGCDVTEIAWHV